MTLNEEIERLLQDSLESGLAENPVGAIYIMEITEKILHIFDEANVNPHIALHVILLVTQTVVGLIEQEEQSKWESN